MRVYPSGVMPAEFLGVLGEDVAAAATAAATVADRNTRTKIGLDLHLSFLSVLRTDAHYPAGTKCRPDI